ncbi:MAG: glycosyltransferase family 1 protein [Cyanobacteria bacterium J06638_28]
MARQLLVNLSFLSTQPTGISTYALNIIPALKSFDPLLFSPHKTPCYSAARHHFTSPQMSTDCGKLGHFRRLFWLQLSALNRIQKPSQGIVFTPLPEAPIFTNCRYIATAHDTIPLRFPDRSPSSFLNLYFKYYVPQVLRQAEHVICNSETTAADIIDAYGVPASRITPIYLGYDKSVFRPLNTSPQNYFFYVGRHSPHKNLMRLIQAFSQVNDPEVELWMGGLGHRRYTPRLKACAQELGVSDRVRFLDYVSPTDLPVMLSQALAFVFPSLWEGFGLPILEAMACGTPVISSNCAAMPEVAGDAALLIDPYNPDALAQAMTQILKDSHLRKDLRGRGLAQVKRFSWSQAGTETATVLSQYG